MEFLELDEEGLAILTEWYEDAEVLNWLSGTLPLDRWFNFVQQSPNYFAWMVWENGVPVGQIDVEIYEDATASISLLTNPQLRYAGYGPRMLRELLTRHELSSVKMIKVSIESDNTASIKCFKKVGFNEAGIDEDDLVVLTCSLGPTSAD